MSIENSTDTFLVSRCPSSDEWIAREILNLASGRDYLGKGVFLHDSRTIGGNPPFRDQIAESCEMFADTVVPMERISHYITLAVSQKLIQKNLRGFWHLTRKGVKIRRDYMYVKPYFEGNHSDVNTKRSVRRKRFGI